MKIKSTYHLHIPIDHIKYPAFFLYVNHIYDKNRPPLVKTILLNEFETTSTEIPFSIRIPFKFLDCFTVILKSGINTSSHYLIFSNKFLFLSNNS